MIDKIYYVLYGVFRLCYIAVEEIYNLITGKKND